MNEHCLIIQQLQRIPGLYGQKIAKRMGNTPLHLNNIIVNGRPKPGQGAFSDLCMELGKEKIEVEHSERFQLAARHREAATNSWNDNVELKRHITLFLIPCTKRISVSP